MQRFASVVELRADKADEYRRLHAAIWPEVAAILSTAHVRNYSIYQRRLPDGRIYLFSYLEYLGNDFPDDMAKLAAEPVTQRWWAVCKPCHEPLPDRLPEEWWAAMEEVFHLD